MSIISPTPGRIVWFFPGPHDPLQSFPSVRSGEALAGHVAKVWSDTMVNLMVIDPDGHPHGRTSVHLVQDDAAGVPAPRDAEQSHATWMPYQKGQAAKAEATQVDSHASKVLYPAIEAAMKVLRNVQPGANSAVDLAFNHLHRAFWSECPAPASADPVRPLPDTAEA